MNENRNISNFLIRFAHYHNLRNVGSGIIIFGGYLIEINKHTVRNKKVVGGNWLKDK